MKSNTILAANAASWIVVAVLGALLVVAIILAFVFYKKTVLLSHKVEALNGSKAAAQAEAARLAEEQTELKKKLVELERIIEEKNVELAKYEAALNEAKKNEQSDGGLESFIKAKRFIFSIEKDLLELRGAESIQCFNEGIQELLDGIENYFDTIE